jgi:hypothetical protein
MKDPWKDPVPLTTRSLVASLRTRPQATRSLAARPGTGADR